jgi:hypothetical protein
VINKDEHTPIINWILDLLECMFLNKNGMPTIHITADILLRKASEINKKKRM